MKAGNHSAFSEFLDGLFQRFQLELRYYYFGDLASIMYVLLRLDVVGHWRFPEFFNVWLQSLLEYSWILESKIMYHFHVLRVVKILGALVEFVGHSELRRFFEICLLLVQGNMKEFSPEELNLFVKGLINLVTVLTPTNGELDGIVEELIELLPSITDPVVLKNIIKLIERVGGERNFAETLRMYDEAY